MVMVTQLCIYYKLVKFKKVNFMVCEWDFNKAVRQNVLDQKYTKNFKTYLMEKSFVHYIFNLICFFISAWWHFFFPTIRFVL